LPIDSALEQWPIISLLSDAAIYYIQRGQPIITPQAPASVGAFVTNKW